MSLVRVALVVGIIALLVRLPAVGAFMTVDELNWMQRSDLFIENLLVGDLEGTFQGTHPGATAMWLMGTGIGLQEWRLGLDITADNLIFFQKAAVIPVTLAIAFLIGLTVWLLGRLTSWRVSLAGGILLAVEPYLVGMSQVAHLDALGAFLMLTALLAFANYLVGKSRKLVYLTGVLTGLALGVKLLLALWLLPSFVGMALLSALAQRRWGMLKRSARALAAIGAIALIVFIVLWPTVLTKKDFQLGYLSRDTKTIITDEHGSYYNAEIPIEAWTFYGRSVLGRLTPATQLLFVGGVVVLATRLVQRRGRLNQTEHTMLYLLLYTVGFLLCISLAAKKADRYTLAALATWPIIGGWFVVVISQWLQARVALPRRAMQILAVAVGLSVLSVPLLWSPYAIAYSNPWWPNVRPLPQQGWGEGLEAAAAWLNERPGAGDIYVASWYPSVMRTYFHGKTMSLSSRDDYRVQYLVTYRNMGGRAPDEQASDVLDEVRDMTPVHTVYIRGVPYAWIYETRSVGNFTKHVGELTGARNVGQTVRPKTGPWSSLDLGFATFSSRKNTEDIIVHVRQSPQATNDLRTVRVNARDIVDNEWQRFEFAPIDVTDGQEFYIMIDSPTSTPGNAVTIRYTDLDIIPGEMYRNGVPKPGDIAYRIADWYKSLLSI